MFCSQCGHDAGANRYCGNCGTAVNSGSAVQRQGTTGGSSTPPIPPPPPGPATPPLPPPSRPNTAERLAVTGKVVGLSGCMLALVFWIVIPLVGVLVALAASSSEGLAVVVGLVALIGGFIYWVWRRTGR